MLKVKGYRLATSSLYRRDTVNEVTIHGEQWSFGAVVELSGGGKMS
jgi:hypothetical protein